MTDAFLEHRPLLFGIAYRMLGSVAEAEDAVQDTYLRWQDDAVAKTEIRSPKAWLITTITRLSIDRLRSARHQREQYFGVWLPEPLLGTAPVEGATTAALADSLGMAFLLMLETMTPDERAVFLLREAFDYDYAEIGAIVGKSEANCRQIIRRAKEHLTQRPPTHSADPVRAEALVQQFLACSRSGDMAGLLAVLATDATLATDGGGRVRASPQPILGAEKIARFLAGIRANIPADTDFRLTMVNGGTGVIASSGGVPISVLSFLFADGRIAAVYAVSNPEKLRHIPPGDGRATSVPAP